MNPPPITTSTLSYEWPSNIEEYEPKILMGLTAIESMAGVMALLVPVATLQNAAGLLLGLIAAVTVILSIKKIERFDSLSLVAYFLAWLIEGRKQERVTMPLVSATGRSTLQFASATGAVQMLLAHEEEELSLPWEERASGP